MDISGIMALVQLRISGNYLIWLSLCTFASLIVTCHTTFIYFVSLLYTSSYLILGYFVFDCFTLSCFCFTCLTLSPFIPLDYILVKILYAPVLPLLMSRIPNQWFCWFP